MKSLNPMSESVLKYIINTTPLDEKISLEEIIGYFTYSKNEICAILSELQKYEYIIFQAPDDFSYGVIMPTSAGILYFANKMAEQQQSQTTNINISNSQGFNIGSVSNSVVGNNNTAMINCKDIILNIKNEIDNYPEDREELKQIVSMLELITEDKLTPHKGIFSKFSALMEKHSWLSGSVASTIIAWLML